MLQLPIVFPSDFVKKSNEFIRNRLTINDTLAGRILAIATSALRIDDIDFFTYRIPTNSFFSTDCNIGGSQYDQMKKAIADLSKAGMEKKFGKNGFVRYPLFYRIAYDEGFIEITFHPEVKPFFLDLKEHFTKYNLVEFLMLPSIYSQRIFEILKSWNGCPEILVPILELQDVLNVPSSLKNDFTNFRRRVLEKAHLDITKNTSLCYEWEPIKTKNKVTAIRFIFSQENKTITKEIKIKKLTDKFIAEQARPGETWEEARERLSNR